MYVVIFNSCATLPPGHSLFFTKEKRRERKIKKLPHANIYTVISFNCARLFNLPWTNAFKSGAGGILLKLCLTQDRVFLIAVAS
jgi:hypothetical protein